MKNYIKCCVLLLLPFMITSCGQPVEMPISSLTSSVNPTATSEALPIIETCLTEQAPAGMAVEYGGDVYLCFKNSVVKFDGVKTTETVYESEKIIGGIVIHQQKMYVELVTETDPPSYTCAEVDLDTGIVNDSKQKNAPSIIDGDFYYWVDDELIMTANETDRVVLKNLYYYQFSNSRIYFINKDERETIYSCALDGKDIQKEIILPNLEAFEVYNGKIFYDTKESSDVFVYEMSSKNTINLGAKFYRSSLVFDNGYAYANLNDTRGILRINTTDYSTKTIEMDIDMWHFDIIDGWLYAQERNGVYGETQSVAMYRMKLDGSNLEKIG